MTFIWIIIFILTPAGISAGTTVTGHRGRSVQIKCPYDSGYETYIKYLCRGECSTWGTKDIPVQSGSAEDQRFSLDDDTAARVFTITITDLRPEDAGPYWCGINRPSLLDLFTEILLLVKTDARTTVSPSTYSPPSVQTQSTPPSSFLSTDPPADPPSTYSPPSVQTQSTPLSSFLLTAGITAVTTVTGHTGQSVQIKCPYDSGYETYIKYLCRAECSDLWGTKDIPVQSGSAEDQRFSLDDDTAARVFTITITDLRPEDGGTYWCGIQRPKAFTDHYTEILLLVKLGDPPADPPSTYSPPSVQTQSTPLSSFPSTGFIILGVCVLLLISGTALGVLVLLFKRRKPRGTSASFSPATCREY
ncbi:hypothetical protein MHYP_G00102540 [Metynnis hypsauchen]